jgi:hypothetical protein
MRDIVSLFREAGFRRIECPLLRLPSRRFLQGASGLIDVKLAVEPVLEVIPYRTARAFCKVLAMECVIGWK